jgi:hypothetical protein
VCCSFDDDFLVIPHGFEPWALYFIVVVLVSEFVGLLLVEESSEAGMRP